MNQFKNNFDRPVIENGGMVLKEPRLATILERLRSATYDHIPNLLALGRQRHHISSWEPNPLALNTRTAQQKASRGTHKRLLAQSENAYDGNRSPLDNPARHIAPNYRNPPNL
eukprot:3747838-Amphidinium_carterae.1